MEKLTRIILILLIPTFALVACKGGQKTRKIDPKDQIAKDPLPEIEDESDIPEDIRRQYREDAARLTLRDLEARIIGQVTAADLPPEWVDYYYDKLKKIYRAFRDDAGIPNLSHIHTLPSPNLRMVTVTLDEDCPWKDRWDDQIISTEELTLNQLTSRYKMGIADVRSGVTGNYYQLVSANPLNTKEFCRLLNEIDGIQSAEPEMAIGDGNNIQTARSTRDNLKKILFSIGWGDCPSGCINRTYWSFEVQEDGSVIYLGQSGDEPPADLGADR